MNRPISQELKFWDHVEELRKRLIRALIGVAIGASAGLYFGDYVLAFLTSPVIDALPDAKLAVLSPLEGFNVYFMVSIWGGVLLALPWVFWQLWGFIGPGLYRNEQYLVLPLVGASTILFLTGAGLCWWLLPEGLKFLAKFTNDGTQVIWSLDKYITFVVLLALSFGIMFQLPLVMAVLIRLGIVSPKTFRDQRRFAYLAIILLAAVVTPTTDAFTLGALSIPLLLLYEISIIFGSLWQRRSQQAAD